MKCVSLLNWFLVLLHGWEQLCPLCFYIYGCRSIPVKYSSIKNYIFISFNDRNNIYLSFHRPDISVYIYYHVIFQYLHFINISLETCTTAKSLLGNSPSPSSINSAAMLCTRQKQQPFSGLHLFLQTVNPGPGQNMKD